MRGKTERNRRGDDDADDGAIMHDILTIVPLRTPLWRPCLQVGSARVVRVRVDVVKRERQAVAVGWPLLGILDRRYRRYPVVDYYYGRVPSYAFIAWVFIQLIN